VCDLETSELRGPKLEIGCCATGGKTKTKTKTDTRQNSNDRRNRLCQQFCIHLSEQEQQARYVIFAFLQNIHSECCCTIHKQRDKPLGTPHTVLWALSTLFTLSDIDCACRYQTFDIFQTSQMTIREDVTQRPQLPSCEPNDSLQHENGGYCS